MLLRIPHHSPEQYKDLRLVVKQFYYLIARLRNELATFDQLTSRLQAEGFDILISSQDRQPAQPPKISVFVRPLMKKLASIYGDRISFDLTFNLVKQSSQGGATWKIGAFLATSSTGKIVPIGLTVVDSMTKQSYIELFRMFFRAHQSQPTVIVSDEERAIHSAIKELQEPGQYIGIHLYDGYHIIHNVYKRLSIKPNIKYFSSLVKAKNYEEFREQVTRAERNLGERELPVLRKFLERKQKYCLSQVQKEVFFGFSSSSSLNESFHSMVKKNQPSQKSYGCAIANVLECCNRLLSNCEKFQEERFPYDKALRLPQLKGIRLCLSKSIYAQFLGELFTAFWLEVTEIDDKMYIRQLSSQFPVILQDGAWQCNYGYIQKSALPCRHLIKVLLFKELPLIDYIPPRWKAFRIQQSSEVIRGRERSSRRKIYGMNIN